MQAMRLIKLFVFFFVVIAMASYAYAAQLDGRVHEATSGKGIVGLTVKLIPPKNTGIPEKITFTGNQGEFHFFDIKCGQYMIEAYQGVTILYRDVIMITQDTQKDIALQKQ
jgi:hypothetical protein